MIIEILFSCLVVSTIFTLNQLKSQRKKIETLNALVANNVPEKLSNDSQIPPGIESLTSNQIDNFLNDAHVGSYIQEGNCFIREWRGGDYVVTIKLEDQKKMYRSNSYLLTASLKRIIPNGTINLFDITGSRQTIESANEVMLWLIVRSGKNFSRWKPPLKSCEYSDFELAVAKVDEALDSIRTKQ